MRSCEQRRSGERHRRGTSATTVGLSRRESFTRIVVVVSGVVSIVANIKTWFTPPLPQRQAVELSGGTHHRVDAGSVELVFTLSQPRVTVVPEKAPVAWRV